MVTSTFTPAFDELTFKEAIEKLNQLAGDWHFAHERGLEVMERNAHREGWAILDRGWFPGQRQEMESILYRDFC